MIIDTKLNFLIWDLLFKRRQKRQEEEEREKELQKYRKTNAELFIHSLCLQVRVLSMNVQNDLGVTATDILFNAEFYRALVKKVKTHAPTLLSFGDAETPDMFAGLNVSTHAMMPVDSFYVGTAENIAEHIEEFKKQYATKLETSPLASEIAKLDKEPE